MVHEPGGEGVERGDMAQTYINEVRQMLRDHYDRLLLRKAELEKEVKIYEPQYLPYDIPYWGRAFYYEEVGTKPMAPPSVEDEIAFTREELKRWSILNT